MGLKKRKKGQVPFFIIRTYLKLLPISTGSNSINIQSIEIAEYNGFIILFLIILNSEEFLLKIVIKLPLNNVNIRK
jgi:hypothetical protein